MKRYIVYTDGSVSKEHQIGGWGAVVRCVTPGHETQMEFNGATKSHYMTSTKMELVAVLNAIKQLPKNSHITIYTDSKHIVFGSIRGIKIWPENNWISRADNFIRLKNLWEEFIVLKKKYNTINLNWVKGHSNNTYNLRADTLARMATEGKMVSPQCMDKTFSVFIHFSRVQNTHSDYSWIFNIQGQHLRYEESSIEFSADWHVIHEKITQKIANFLNDKGYHFAHIYSDSKNFHFSFDSCLKNFHFMHVKDKKIEPEKASYFRRCKDRANYNLSFV